MGDAAGAGSGSVGKEINKTPAVLSMLQYPGATITGCCWTLLSYAVAHNQRLGRSAIDSSSVQGQKSA